MPQENKGGKKGHGTRAQPTLLLTKPLGRSTDPILEFPACFGSTAEDKSSAWNNLPFYHILPETP